MVTRLRFNTGELGKLLKGEGRYSGVRDDLGRRMGRAEEAAVADAPVITGNYRDQLRVEVVDNGQTAEARLVAGADYSIYVEADQGVLLRALDAAGD